MKVLPPLQNILISRVVLELILCGPAWRNRARRALFCKMMPGCRTLGVSKLMLGYIAIQGATSSERMLTQLAASHIKRICFCKERRAIGARYTSWMNWSMNVKTNHWWCRLWGSCQGTLFVCHWCRCLELMLMQIKCLWKPNWCHGFSLCCSSFLMFVRGASLCFIARQGF